MFKFVGRKKIKIKNKFVGRNWKASTGVGKNLNPTRLCGEKDSLLASFATALEKRARG